MEPIRPTQTAPARRPERAAELVAEIAESERYADELAAFATNLRMVGHDDAAERLLHFSRRYRVAALNLRGSLAALA